MAQWTHPKISNLICPGAVLAGAANPVLKEFIELRWRIAISIRYLKFNKGPSAHDTGSECKIAV